MNIKSDIKFIKQEGEIFRRVKKYFKEVEDSGIETDSFEQINYMVFMYCAYIGFTVNEETDEILDLDEIEEETSFNVPRIIMLQYTTRIKELLICAEYIKNNYVVTGEDLQTIWNQESLGDNSELLAFIKEKALLGARYFAKMVDAKFEKGIVFISRELDEKLDSLLKDMDAKKTEFDILSDDLEMFV